MEYMDILMKYWSDPAVEIVPAGKTDEIIAWLGQQTPETWHCVVGSWNYDHGNKVLAWVLGQDRCDRGTAARIFFVEGMGSWLWDVDSDPQVFEDRSHVCRMVLDNWHRYQTGTFAHGYQTTDAKIESFLSKDNLQDLMGPLLEEILRYQGSRKAESMFASQDGKIMIALSHWVKTCGIEGAADAVRPFMS